MVDRLVLRGVDPIREVHLREPGMLVIDVAAHDAATALAFQDTVARMWATSPAERTTRKACEHGVRLRLYTDLRQDQKAAFEPST
ncbi:hypothetical protein AQJ23_16290 [Streptomyces antibioticus]|nr:DUF6207 family protein [Streptomyces antibioticus]KUN25445.1 hypothetical protein AQJ23_16290 [Streptomyces antibioticus]